MTSRIQGNRTIVGASSFAPKLTPLEVKSGTIHSDTKHGIRYKVYIFREGAENIKKLAGRINFAGNIFATCDLSEIKYEIFTFIPENKFSKIKPSRRNDRSPKN